MPSAEITRKMDALRERLASEHVDPKTLHDQVCDLMKSLEAHSEHIPADLREAAEELHAEILEQFYDNLPV